MQNNSIGMGHMLASVGNVCLQWALLEQHIAVMIWIILDCDGELGAIFVGGLDMMPRLNMAINLAEHFKAPGKLRSDLRALRTHVQKNLIDRRNTVVHGVHGPTGFDDTSELLMLRLKGPKRFQTVSAKDVATLSDEIRKTWQSSNNIIEQLKSWKANHSVDGE